MNSVRLDPQGPYKRDPPPPHELRDRLTPTQGMFVQSHLGVAHIDQHQWSLTIDGMVDRPRTLRFDDLVRHPKTEVTSVHQCCGSPFAPFQPTRRVCTVRWGGVRLVDLLRDCRPRAAARYMWSYGADFGEFGGVAVDAFVKDLPVARWMLMLDRYEVNGSPLPAEHGFPARLVVPGFYGTNSVKWLTRIALVESRAPGPFTTRWYSDPVLDGNGRNRRDHAGLVDVRIAHRLAVAPRAHRRSVEREIWGWAWADGGVRQVYLRTDEAGPWLRAELEPQRGREWQRFSLRWQPSKSGEVVLAALAEATHGLLSRRRGGATRSTAYR